MNTQLLTHDDVQKIAKVSRRTIYNWIRKGQFPPSVRVGGLARWLEEDVQEWVRNLH